MFATMHIKMNGVNAETVRCITSQATFHPGKGSTSSFMKSIRSKRFNVIRVIFERELSDCTEYHCIDYTGNSFIMHDINKKTHTGRGLVEWIEKIDQHLGMTIHDSIIVHEISESCHISRSPSKEEEYYHQYVRTEVAEYFQANSQSTPSISKGFK